MQRDWLDFVLLAHLLRRWLIYLFHRRSSRHVIGTVLVIELHKFVGGGVIVRDAGCSMWNRRFMLDPLRTNLIDVQVTLIFLTLHSHVNRLLGNA